MGDRRPMVPVTSGGFDSPPATSSNNAASAAVTSRLESLRRALEETREQARARPIQRPGPLRPNRHRHRNRDSGISALLPDPRHSPVVDAPLDFGDDRQRKRRKLHHPEPEAAFTYGHYGQVEAGRLRFLVESCDGDIHNDRGGIDYGPDNILKHDKSVYCTRSSRCNIVLRHHDSSPFTLEKLQIITPESGFTAPLRQGLVFIGMSREDLLPHIHTGNQRQQQQQPPPPSPPRSPPGRANEETHLSLLESLNDPEVSRALLHGHSREWSPFDASTDQNSSSIEDEDSQDPWSGTRDIPWPPLEPSNVDRRPMHQSADLTACDDQMSAPYNESAHVILVTDDEVDWPEDPTGPDVLEDRQRRDRSMAAGEDGDMYGWDTRYHAAHPRVIRGRRTNLQRKQREELPASPDFDQARNDGVTRARFEIKDGKHNVAIKFEPPISGTHILLKLQTPFPGKNIDIQTVIASGYAGPRFFPAINFR